ncbi:LysM peptidoglycan-binding domain-containing protein [Oceanobacillus piezotolerans]|uniref:LysM peptidoglycan-binding domain-containing protein n=1 Tax=Oceanobacillus piezotolerans TaxID=2448030 RepID=A0A498D3M2_9BACI|nr:3D domain-containing protein [Oceanobacillus piezotolerans]RLL42811.1 LysM peptidoglycan-binding domain-containing protein [Oceanobacillus piezotolerans]
MKKTIAALIAGMFIAGTQAVSVSAESYEVQDGDSLWNIAEENNTTVEELMNINELKETMIHPKQVLLLNGTYTVNSGDTLTSIAKENNVSTQDLKEWNNLSSDIIVIGQALSIKGAAESANMEQTEQVETTSAEANNEAAESEAVETTSAPKEEVTENNQAETDQDVEGKTISVSATAYTADCEGCSGVTYTGVDLNKNRNAKVIAVDPNVIPLGSKVYVEGYGYATAADIGGAIKGNKIDLHVPTTSEAKQWGVRTVDVTIVE